MRTETIHLNEQPQKIGRHPAKMHPALATALIQDYTAEGDLVLDPFAGCGTTLWAATRAGRRCVGVEIELPHAAQAKTHGATINGDATRLPLGDASVDAVVTSPPYGEAVGRSGDRAPEKTAANKQRYEERRFGRKLTPHAVYGVHPRNMGALPLTRSDAPCFTALLPLAISEMVRVVKPGGHVVLVVKDQKLGRRALGAYDLPGDVVRWGRTAGAVFVGRRFGILPPACWTLWQRVNFTRWGHPVPDVEHVIVLRRPA